MHNHFRLKSLLYASLPLCLAAMNVDSALAQAVPTAEKYSCRNVGNPYLPLWEHMPDGEPRVFEDPDRPGHYRFYIISSHDVRATSYCGPDIHCWSAPFEDLSQWRDEGSIFTYNIDNQWDVMYAPDMVEVVDKNGKKTYYLYPNCRGRARESIVAKADRPDGPFKAINVSEDGRTQLPGSCIGYDPSVFVETITDKNDPDYATGYRVYAFHGFQNSTAVELDPKTMYTVRPGTEPIRYFIPASRQYGQLLDPEGTKYPSLYSEQNPGDFNFFEASSIRQVGNKYIMVFSGYSGPDYGLGSTNSALRYAFGDSPMGPWRSGGVLVDSRGVVMNEDGTALTTSNSSHNTHGSLQCINGQWYIFYHRPPRGNGNARQSMVAPVKIVMDDKKVADGGIVKICGYDPYASDESWVAAASNGMTYTGGEVTSEGFQIYGLPPYDYYSAGIACYMSNPGWMQDTWDCWDNHMDLTGITAGGIVGFKYFGFEGLKKDSKGVKAFEGAKKGNQTKLNLWITPRTDKAFTIRVMIDGPWANDAWKGKQIASINVGANRSGSEMQLTFDVAKEVEGLKGKHAIYFIADCEGSDGREAIYDMHGLGFTSKKHQIARHQAPSIQIMANGKALEVPATPIRSTNQNGICDVRHYSVYNPEGADAAITANIKSADGKTIPATITKSGNETLVKATYRGLEKTFHVTLEKPAPPQQQRRFPF